MSASVNIEGITAKVKKFLSEKNWFTDALAFIEGKTGVSRQYLLTGGAAFLLIFLAVKFASAFIVALLGFLYPAYSSVKAIESTNKEDDTQWLTYWVVYSAFSIAEFFSDLLLSWFPMYLVFKCMFLGWCMAPFSWNGSEFIYHRFISPFVIKHSAQVDDLIANATQAAQDISEKAKEAAVEQIVENSTKKD